MSLPIEEIRNIPGIFSAQLFNPVTFIYADNLSFLRYLKDEMRKGYFHLGIVDPPYGIDVSKMNLGMVAADKKTLSYERGNWDSEIPTQEYWDLLWYCCRNLIVWGGNYFVSNFGRTVNPNTLKEDPIPNGRCFGVWDKGNDKMSFAPCELILTTFDRNAFIIRRPRGNHGEDESKKRHDTQKPVFVYDYLHLNFVEKGQRVLDTHGGSFNHAIAAYKNNVNLTIIDKEESYYLSGIENYKEKSMKGRLLF